MDAESFEVGLKTFNRICEAWKLSDDDRLQLLGSGSKENQLIHISYVIGIYKNLHILFENASQADTWIHRPSRDFEGHTALNIMLEDDLKRVRSYLDSMISN